MQGRCVRRREEAAIENEDPFRGAGEPGSRGAGEPGSRGVMDPLDLVPGQMRPALLDDPGFAALFRSLGRDPRNARGLVPSARIAMRGPRTFSRHFRVLAYRTWGEFVREWRLQSALLLLPHPLTSVKEVAARVGLHSSEAFSDAFTRRFGVGPREWRRRREEPDEGPAAEGRP